LSAQYLDKLVLFAFQLQITVLTAWSGQDMSHVVPITLKFTKFTGTWEIF